MEEKFCIVTSDVAVISANLEIAVVDFRDT